MGGSVNGIRAWLSEFRRRGVFHVTGLYAVGAWAVVQLVDAISGPFPLPETALRLIWFAALLGFPVAVVFGWRYDITKKGIVRTHRRLSHGEDVPISRGDYGFIGALALVMVGIVGMTTVGVLDAIEEATLKAAVAPEIFEPQANSVAVLAFENMSADPEREYFSDGLSEEILNLLAQIKGLKVIARQSSFSFKDKDVDIATMARQLNVRHILEGSVRSSGERVRITAQLIDAKDSSHLWSQTFDRDYGAEDLFDIQSEIARTIADRLRVTLTGEDEARLARVPTKNTEAYTAYLIGRDRLRDRKVEGLADAVEQFVKAIELDPQFAGAWSGLADACFLYQDFSGGHRKEHCPASPAEREQLARKAVELDPESGEAWISLGNAIYAQAVLSLESMPKVREAIAAYERGLELNPNLSQGYHWYALALRIPRLLYPDPPWGWNEARKAGVWASVYDKGLEVDPLSVTLHHQKSYYPQVARSLEEAIWHAHRMVEIAPDSPRGYERVGQQAWEFQGRLDESIRWMKKALAIDPEYPGYPVLMGRAYSALGDPEMALAWFDVAKAISAPDNQDLQNSLLVEQAVILLVSGQQVAHEVAELHALLSESTSDDDFGFGVFTDVAMGNSADALARIGRTWPKCIRAKDIPEGYWVCPIELVRVYQELGDETAARDLADTMVQESKKWSEEWPGYGARAEYAAALATAGHADQALDVLEDLVSSGWRGHFRSFLRFSLYFDVNFDAIREHKRFQAIVATIEADMAQQLENVRAMQQRGEVPTLEEVRALIAARREDD